ncbi:hypothetical protein BT63DRAFT_455743 [Microthyrium microscopicum]|uniref:Uncharacterized protein n=1 Tax=Microthyrium microscopicum TaxID=703497 RepID=A0A6A6UE61_9PEZI|nr:hypothetical protein BT63DRAFT_455743 [Microthyrium microscopicum]
MTGLPYFNEEGHSSGFGFQKCWDFGLETVPTYFPFACATSIGFLILRDTELDMMAQIGAEVGPFLLSSRSQEY